MLARSAAALLVVALLVGPASGAQTATPWTGPPRRVDYESDAQGFRFTSTRAGQTDELAGRFRLSDASFEWSFRANASESPFGSRLLVGSLLEWRDVDGDGRFGVGDQVVRRQDVASLPNASIETLPKAPEGRVVHVTYPFPGGKPGPLDPLTGRQIVSDAGLTVSFYIFGAPPAVGTLQVDPMRVPVEVRIDKWPRTRSDTLIGLELSLQSAGTMRVAASTWNATDAKVEHDLTWSHAYVRNGTTRTATVNAIERPGSPGLGPSSAQTTLLATYEYGDILHSFSFGTQPVASALPDLEAIVENVLGDPRTYMAGAAAASLIVGVTAGRKLQRRG